VERTCFDVDFAADAQERNAGYALGDNGDGVVVEPAVTVDLDNVVPGDNGEEVIDHESDILGKIQEAEWLRVCHRWG
jgi:hypothetical protein